MRVDLPNDGWAEIKETEELTAGDLGAVHRAVRFDMDDSQRLEVHAGVQDEMRNALLSRVIKSWSLDLPVPMGNPNLVENIPLAAYKELADAVKEHMDLVNFIPNRKSSSD